MSEALSSRLWFRARRGIRPCRRLSLVRVTGFHFYIVSVLDNFKLLGKGCGCYSGVNVQGACPESASGIRLVQGLYAYGIFPVSEGLDAVGLDPGGQ